MTHLPSLAGETQRYEENDLDKRLLLKPDFVLF